MADLKQLQKRFGYPDIDFERPLTKLDIQMIKSVGRPLSNFELRQIDKGIPFADVQRSALQQFRALNKGLGRAKGTLLGGKPGGDPEEAEAIEQYLDLARKFQSSAIEPGQTYTEVTELAQASPDVRAASSGTGKEIGKFKSDVITRDNLGESDDPFVTGEKPLPPGFKLATHPNGQIVPIPETHTFDAQGNLVFINQPFIPSTGVPGNQGQMGKFRSDVVTRDILSDVKFNTGNPDLDDFLNNTWVPLLRAETQSLTNPQDILNPEVFAKIKERVNTTWGPIFQKELQLAEEAFGRSQTELTARKEETLAELGRTRQRTIEEEGIQRGRTIEESGILKDRIARNYSQALEESKASFASRGLAFSGIRGEAERRLEEERSEKTFDVERGAGQQLADLARSRERTLEDILAGEQSTQGAFGRSLEELQAGLTEQKRGIEGERTLQEAQERARLRSLGGDILQNPELFNF